ncbi:MAG: TonB-dependent receptor [Alphaproteobacteria bacterium]|nr:TonB-dependent receptor [Alphaproteobacteria bacterium]
MRKSLRTLPLGMLVALWATPSVAQQVAVSGEALDEIVVTTQKREQKLIDVPINISVLSQSRMDMLGADDLEEIADFVPGLEIQAQSLNAPSFALRGITSDGGRSRVAVFQNGVAIGNLRFGQSLAQFDMERIEVVKGPQATLFGQGALVGGINFIQNHASTKGNSGALRFDLGNYEYQRAEGHFNWAVSDTLALRFAGQIKNRDGYVPNSGNSPDLMGQKTSAARVSARFTPTPSFTADLTVNVQQDDSTGTQFKSGTFPPAGGDLSPYSTTAMNINSDQLRSKLGNDRDVFSVTAELSYAFNDAWRLTSITDYRNIQSLEAFDSDGTALNLLQFGLHDKGHSASQELRLNYDAGGRIAAFFGANYYDEGSSQLLRFSTDEAHLQALFAPTIAGAARLSVAQLEGALALARIPNAANFDNVLNPLRVSALGALQGRPIPLNPAHLEQNLAKTTTKATDVFADLTFRATDKLSITGGLRYTKEELSASAISALVRGNPALGGQLNGIFFNQLLLSRLSPGVLRSRSQDSDGALTWRFNAAYKISPDINTWVAVGRGRRPEAVVADAAQPSGFTIVTEEIYDHVETGVAGYFFDRALRVTSSIYYGQYKDFQTSRFSPTAGTFITENSGNATQYGFEFEGEWAVNRNVDLFGSYAYNFSQYDDTDDAGNRLQFAGNSFRLSPENNVSLGADLRWPLANGGKVFFVPTYIWKDEHFFEDDNDPREFENGYGLLDLKLGYSNASGRFTGSVFVENAADEEYLIDGGNTGGAFGIPTYIRGVPRMYGVSLNFSF